MMEKHLIAMIRSNSCIDFITQSQTELFENKIVKIKKLEMNPFHGTFIW